MDPQDFNRMDSLRARLYQMVSDNPGGPDADRARGLLARMPKAPAPAGPRMPGATPDEVAPEDVAVPQKDRIIAAARKAPRQLATETERELGEIGTLATNAVDTASLGVYRRGRNALESAIAPQATAESLKGEQQYEQANPFKVGLARGAGYLSPVGAPAMIGRSAAGLASAAAESAPAALGAALATRPVAGALTGALTAGGTNLAEDATAGVPMREALPAAGRSALLGAGIGVGAGLVAEGASSLRDKLRNPKNELGRTIRTLDANGRTIRSPEFQALPAGAEGFNTAAADAEESIASRVDAEKKAARQRYGADQQRILDSHADRHHLIVDSHDALKALEANNTINGVAGNEHLDNAIKKVRQMLTTTTDQLDYGATVGAQQANPKAPAEYVSAPAVKVGDLIKVKRIVADKAGYGAPATPETLPYRRLDHILGQELESIDPEMAAVNQRYADTMRKAETAHEILYGDKSPDVQRSLAQQKRAAGALGRIGDSTQAATNNLRQIERLKALDPAYAEDIAKVEAKKAFERTRFGLPHVSRRIEHMPLALIMQNVDAAGARIVDPTLEAIGGTTAPQGSVIPRGARVSDEDLKTNPLTRALAGQKKRNAHAARVLGGQQ